jgi:predicted alpha-1,2-mannosidase
MKVWPVYLIAIASLIAIAGCHKSKNIAAPLPEPALPMESYNQWVNPFIGTGGHGHTYPGATRPFGMVQLSPDTRLEGWDGCGGYHYDDSLVYGFSHTHLQGTGVSDYGDILFMPTNHKIHSADSWRDAYRSKFSHKNEMATPGYYQVKLTDYNINVELTATERAGIQRYQFAPGDSCRLFLDLMHRDELLWYDIGTVGDTVIYGYRVSKGWATEQHCYFYAVFSKPFHNFNQLDITYDEPSSDGIRRQTLEQVQVFSVQFDPTDEIMVKVGVSGTDIDGARNNLHAEAKHWNFDQYKKEASDSWTTQLNKLQIAEGNPEEKTKFYTAAYHCFTTPNLWSDVDGRYRGMDNELHTAVGYNYYTVFSLWDTFRALHPLLKRVEPERTRDFIRSFLDMYKENEYLPVWELAANETNCMIGYHSASVIADAYFDGIKDFDTNLALEAMINSSNGPQDEKMAYDTLGYVPAEYFSESVSKTLEYAYDDWCIAQFAEAIGRTDVYTRYIKRAQNWKNVFDPTTGFMRARRNGGFIEPFDPYEVNFNYTEANAFQYQFFVPHDIPTLVEYMGGKEAFKLQLNNLFKASSKTSGREQADITGLIGQYAHGNEPSHHIAYLYAVVGETAKCNELVQEIMRSQYHNTPDGLCGNEDCGQMSAWYVMSRLGGYYICPGGPDQRFTYNRSNYTSIENERAPVRSLNYIIAPQERALPAIVEQLITPVPIIQGPQSSFVDSCALQISCAQAATLKIRVYPLLPDGTPRDRSMNEYNGKNNFKLVLNESSKVEVYAQSPGCDKSQSSVATFIKRSGSKKITSVTTFDNQYNAGGDQALVDGLRGGADFRTGSWQGFQGTKVSCFIDLGKSQAISNVSVSCLEEIKSWIWFPSKIEIYISNDGKNYSLAQTLITKEAQDNYTPRTKEFSSQLRASGRYVKVVAEPAFESIPKWHLGAGGMPWIFMDEIIIK